MDSGGVRWDAGRNGTVDERKPALDRFLGKGALWHRRQHARAGVKRWQEGRQAGRSRLPTEWTDCSMQVRFKTGQDSRGDLCGEHSDGDVRERMTLREPVSELGDGQPRCAGRTQAVVRSWCV